MTETPSSAREPNSSEEKYVSQVEEALSQLGTGLSPVAAGDLGSRIGKYQLVQVLHCHGQAVVALAHDPDLDREVILKLYHAAKSDAQRARLLNEGRALAKIQSRHVASVFAVEEFEDYVFLVIEYVRGLSLRELLQQQETPGVVPAEEALPVIRELAEGLRHVHQLGLLHRDLKPENVMVTPEGEVKLIDFGLVSLVDAGNANDRSGTPAYMAPECARGAQTTDDVDERSDIFGLGAVLYDMLCGHPPFAAATNAKSRELSVVGSVTPVEDMRKGIPSEIARLCMRCLSEKPDDRFASAQIVIDELDELMQIESNSPTRNVVTWAVGLTVAALALIALFALLLNPARKFAGLRRNGPDASEQSAPKDNEVETAVSETPVAENPPAAKDDSAKKLLKAGEVIRLRNCEIADHFLSEDDNNNAMLSQDLDNRSLWKVEVHGTGYALKNSNSGRYLTADVVDESWDVFTTEKRAEGTLWILDALEEGSVSLANFSTGRYLDGDGPVDEFDVDESEEVKSDDSWKIERQ